MTTLTILPTSLLAEAVAVVGEEVIIKTAEAADIDPKIMTTSQVVELVLLQ
jgi:hypothetical protein